MLQRCRHAVENQLRNRGFTSPDSRRIMADQILLTITACVAGVLAWPFGTWPMAFGLGALLSSVNLWQIGRFAHWCMGKQYNGTLAGIFFLAYLFRFAATGAVLYLLVVRAHMPPIPLILGLSSLVVWLSVMRFSRGAGHSC